MKLKKSNGMLLTLKFVGEQKNVTMELSILGHDASDVTGSDKTNSQKKIRLSHFKPKAKTKKITGRLNVKGSVVKITVCGKTYKKTIKGNKFTFKLSACLKKKDRITIVVTKKDYGSFKKTYTVR